MFGNLEGVALGPLRSSAQQARFSWVFAGSHLALAAAFGVLSSIVFAGNAPDMLLLGWGLCGAAMLAVAALAVLPAVMWLRLFRALSDTLTFAGLAAVGALLLSRSANVLWPRMSALTFAAVGALLHPLLPVLVQDRANLTIGGPQFSVAIAPECSGMEGIGLMLALAAAWLWFFRREYRFPQAFLLVPIGIGAMWVLNAVRIATLILIGQAGAQGVARGGFHSQAGWIAFLSVALAIAIGSRRVLWLRHTALLSGRDEPAADYPAAAFLAPFLAILAAALVSQAPAPASSGSTRCDSLPLRRHSGISAANTVD